MTKEEFEIKFKGKLVSVLTDFDIPKEYWKYPFMCLGGTKKSGLAKIVLIDNKDKTIYTCRYNNLRELKEMDSLTEKQSTYLMGVIEKLYTNRKILEIKSILKEEETEDDYLVYFAYEYTDHNKERFHGCSDTVLVKHLDEKIKELK